MQELERDSQRIQREKAKLQERIAPLVEAIEQGGASASRSVMDRLAKLESELEDLERGETKVEQRREELRATMSEYETVVRAYRGLADALNSEEDRESLSDLVATIVEQIIWRPAPDSSGKHKYSGGSYDYVVFDNPLLSHEFKKARRLEDGESSLQGQDWLPGEDLPRTVRTHRLYGKAKVFVQRERWRVHFVDEPEERRPVRHGSRRRRAWLKNPIIFARQLRSELDAIPNGTQSMLAERHGVTRTRICQYLRLLDLPEEIVAFTGDPQNEDTTGNITEAALRELLSLPSAYEQMEAFSRMCEEFAERAS